MCVCVCVCVCACVRACVCACACIRVCVTYGMCLLFVVVAIWESYTPPHVCVCDNIHITHLPLSPTPGGAGV